MLPLMKAAELHAGVRVGSGRGQLADGFRYAFSTPILRDVLILMAIIGTLTYEFQVSLPLLAEFTFHGNAASYAALSSPLGIGAVVGGLITASRKTTSFNTVVVAALLFGLAALFASVMPSLLTAVAAVVILGFFSIYFSSTANTTIQLASNPDMRGRVMALWTMAVLGSTTVGGPIIGLVGQQVGARWSLAVGGIAAVIAAAYGFLAMRRMRGRLVACRARGVTRSPVLRFRFRLD